MEAFTARKPSEEKEPVGTRTALAIGSGVSCCREEKQKPRDSEGLQDIRCHKLVCFATHSSSMASLSPVSFPRTSSGKLLLFSDCMLAPPVRLLFVQVLCCCLCMIIAIVIAVAGNYITTFESLF